MAELLVASRRNTPRQIYRLSTRQPRQMERSPRHNLSKLAGRVSITPRCVIVVVGMWSTKRFEVEAEVEVCRSPRHHFELGKLDLSTTKLADSKIQQNKHPQQSNIKLDSRDSLRIYAQLQNSYTIASAMASLKSSPSRLLYYLGRIVSPIVVIQKHRTLVVSPSSQICVP